MSSDAATFERFRAFAEEAVSQLVQEMAEKRREYPTTGGADDVLALMHRVAAIQGCSPWRVWEAWALRHAVAVHHLVQEEETLPLVPFNATAMRCRLMDLLGYCVLGLLLAEDD